MPTPNQGSVHQLRPKPSNVAIDAEGPVAEALAGARVYSMEIDSDLAVPSDVGMGLGLCLTPPRMLPD